MKRLYHADDLVIAQMYIRMYEKYHDPVMIQPTIARVDSIVAKPSKARLWLGAKTGRSVGHGVMLYLWLPLSMDS